ncbi:MAG: ATP-binding protein [Sphingobacteriia bacterium]|nr:MAG: ATP-binding protein [Sphingobacteriia bacterium]
MLVKTHGTALLGIEAIPLQIEVNVSMGQGYAIVGLPDAAIRESLHRTESAIKSIGFKMPRTKLVINLAPAHIRKTGSGLDLPMALGILAASEQIDQLDHLAHWLFMGELGLDGRLLGIRGALSMAIQAKKMGLDGFVLPAENEREASLLPQFSSIGFSHLSEVLSFLSAPSAHLQKKVMPIPAPTANHWGTDFSAIKGQENVKRALEIAAAGSHNLVLIGPPGAGKTLLAKSLPSILPPLNERESLELTQIHSVAGQGFSPTGLVSQRPFRSPHHSVSAIALSGGGSKPQPGEISLAHHGVLFLDELPEFNRAALETLRQPLEEQCIHISRAAQSLCFPAGFMLVAAMNPCPCGFYNHPEKKCQCGPGQIQRYLSKISGPLLDRIDLQVEVAPVPASALLQDRKGEDSTKVRQRVIQAREWQTKRIHNTQAVLSKDYQLPHPMDAGMALDQCSKQLLKSAMEKLQLSARAYHRILKVGRTIADLEGSENLAAHHVSEAIQYRSLDRVNWGKDQY